MNLLKWILLSLAGILLLLIVTGLLVSKIDPVAWNPAPNPGLTGKFAPNNRLVDALYILNGVGHGPEDIARDATGNFYTGYGDGRIVKFLPDGTHSEFANTGGRPLGLAVDADGNLIVCDAVIGLLSIAPDGEISVLTDSVNGEKLRFIDDLDIAGDGTIWFSNASQRFDLNDNFYNFVEGSATGSLLSYSPASGQTRTHVENLFFANGVALGPDESYVLVNETGAARIKRLWLKGPKTGVIDEFHTGLPGMPDNLSYNDNGTFWVALAAPRNADFDALADKPLLRKLIFALPQDWFPPPEPYGFVIGLNVDGEARFNFQAPGGEMHDVTSVNEWDDKLFIGNLAMDAVGVLALKQ